MFADLHDHYPMRVVTGVDPGTTSKLMRSRNQRTRYDGLRALVLRIANRIGNYPSFDGDYRINPKKLKDGEVGLALSVLFRPFQEMDLSKHYAAPPDSTYFDLLLGDLEAVEAEVAEKGPDQVRIVKSKGELDAAIAAGVPALIHAVEGGFHLGDEPAEVEANCAELAARGVGYVTVAHLFFRQVATNANAVPFIPDPLYGIVFPQCGRERLTARGKALVKGLFENRILPDLSHMDPPAIGQTLDFMDEIDPGRTLPVLSTHAGFRFGKQRYMHDGPTLKRIAARGGVVGLIMAQHQLNDGLLPKGEETKTIEDSMPILFKHIDRIKEETGSYDHIAIGSDLDGFIKPSIGGIENISDLPALAPGLIDRYGEEVADQIMWGNAYNVIQHIWPDGETAAGTRE